MHNCLRPKNPLRLALMSVALLSQGLAWPSLGVSSEIEDPIAIYRTGREFLSKGLSAQASESFARVIALRPGSLLALEAGYFDIQARQISTVSQQEDLEELLRRCDDWQCEAASLVQSTPPDRLRDFSAKIHDRIESILALEIQLAFSTQRWLQALPLLKELEHREKSHGTVELTERIPCQLMQLECFIHLHRWQEAEKLAESLQVTAEEKLTHTPPSAWIEPFLLRSAEVAMVLGKWNVAESNVWKIRKHFPECKVSTQVDYVLARCLVHDAKFEEARQLLASILGSQLNPPADLQIKVWWTIAETYLMQRNTTHAYAAYEQVARLGVDSPWAELAQRQMAVCQQASGNAIVFESVPNTEATLRSTQKQTPKQPR